MKIKIVSFIIFPILTIFILSSFTDHSDRIVKKVKKEIASFYDSEDLQISEVKITADQMSTVKSEFGNKNLLKVLKNKEVIGYVYIGNAPSKTATFDYMVLFDTNFVIAKSKVLIYREEYGGEIGSKRWLKQFTGKKYTDSLSYPNDVDAISGATISVRSMATSVSVLLQSIQQLHINGVL